MTALQGTVYAHVHVKSGYYWNFDKMTLLRHLEKSVWRNAYPCTVQHVKCSWGSWGGGGGGGGAVSALLGPRKSSCGVRRWSSQKILGFFVLKRSLWTPFLGHFPCVKTTNKFLWSRKDVTNITKALNVRESST